MRSVPVRERPKTGRRHSFGKRRFHLRLGIGGIAVSGDRHTGRLHQRLRGERECVDCGAGRGVHAVVGSSGLTADDYEELDRLARDRFVGVVAAGNFSIMAAILQRAAALAAEHLDTWEVVDYASADKPDVPSGTSRELAEILAKVRMPSSAVPLSRLSGPAEARGAEVAGTQIHSVRLPGFAVSTEIIFGGTGERLIMRHDPGDSPDPYVAGTLLAIRKVAAVPGVRRGLGSLLFDAPG
jgi:4-hydroxy-tetrahydrodipicolinate reductase